MVISNSYQSYVTQCPQTIHMLTFNAQKSLTTLLSTFVLLINPPYQPLTVGIFRYDLICSQFALNWLAQHTLAFTLALNFLLKFTALTLSSRLTGLNANYLLLVNLAYTTTIFILYVMYFILLYCHFLDLHPLLQFLHSHIILLKTVYLKIEIVPVLTLLGKNAHLLIKSACLLIKKRRFVRIPCLFCPIPYLLYTF